MKSILSLLLFCTTGFFAKAQNEVVVDANAEMRVLNASFKAIKVSGAIDLYLSQSADEAVAVSASEDRFRQGIKTIVENGVLKIYFEGDKLWNFIRNRKMKVYVSFRNMDKLEVSGASDVKGSGFTVDVCNAKASGASDINIAVNKELTINSSGASKISYTGNAMVKEIHSSGASKVKRQ